MKLAIAVPNLGSSQLLFQVIRQANLIVGSHAQIDITLFFETLARPCLPMNFAAMHISEGWGYDGPVVATTLGTAQKLLRFPGPTRRLFYSVDLEYVRRRGSFQQLRNVYANHDLELFARCSDHADALSKAWNRPVKVVPEEQMVNEFLKTCHVQK